MVRFLCVWLVLAAACGPATKSTPAEPAPPAAPATPAPPAGASAQLELGELKLVETSTNKAVLIHADGTIELDGQKPAKVTADGKIVKADTGEVGFTLTGDGRVLGPNGADSGAKLAADGALTVGDKTITLSDSGDLVGANADAPKMHVDGATTPGLKRTAMFVLVALTLPDEEPAPAGSATGPTEPPAEPGK